MKFKILYKLMIGFITIACGTAALGTFALNWMNKLNQNTEIIQSIRMPSMEVLDEIRYTISLYRQVQLQHVIAADTDEMAELETSLQAQADTIDALLDTYAQTYATDKTDEKYVSDVRAGWEAYVEQNTAFLKLSNAGEDEAALALLNGDANAVLAEVAVMVTDWESTNNANSEALVQNSLKTYDSAQTVTTYLVLGVLLLAIALGYFLSRSISTGARLMAEAAEQIAEQDLAGLAAVATALANGDLTQDFKTQSQALTYKSSDEIGQLALAFNQMIARLEETGNAVSRMSNNLRSMISQVADNSVNLSAASEQLASAANQAGQASNQIAVTIQQVATGINQQTEAVNRTATSVEQMGRAIDGVAKGAQEQASATSKASNVTNQLSNAIQQITIRAKEQVSDAEEAVKVSQASAHTVEDMVHGMDKIKSKVDLSADKVQEMGKRSDQVGMIVETIDDIASQTNLLALNAAIEAARAGEHGKGFAVVADEVRKLAEKSAGATKEIAALIRGIQQTVTEAVKAMNESAVEVETGVTLANMSGEALQKLLGSAKNAQNSGEAIEAAAEKMNALANDLVSAMDSVSAVVEENTAATEEMAAGSGEVTNAIENISSVSEENSAAVEEVSASVEEMTSQVEEVTASAASLSDMARGLSELVSQFKIS